MPTSSSSAATSLPHALPTDIPFPSRGEADSQPQLYWSYTPKEYSYFQSLSVSEQGSVCDMIRHVAEKYFSNGEIVERLRWSHREALRLDEDSSQQHDDEGISSTATAENSLESNESNQNQTSDNVKESQKQSPPSQTMDPNFNLDIFTLCRFLRANNFSLKDSKMQLHRYIQYRLTENPYHLTPRDFESRLVMHKPPVGWWQGRDKAGCPFFVLRPQYHDPKHRIMRDALLHCFFMAENVIAKMDNQSMEGQDRYSVLYDGRQITWNMMDFKLVKEFSNLNDYYPERLKAIYVLKPGWFFSSILYAAKKLMNPRTASKIITINDYNQIFEHIEEDQIPSEYMGTSSYEYHHDHLWLPHPVAAFDLPQLERKDIIQRRKARFLKEPVEAVIMENKES